MANANSCYHDQFRLLSSFRSYQQAGLVEQKTQPSKRFNRPVVLLANTTGVFRPTSFPIHHNPGVPMNNLDQMTIDDYFRMGTVKRELPPLVGGRWRVTPGTGR